MQYSEPLLPISTFPNEQQIKELVDSFYSRVRNDELLGPIFAAAIGESWDAHLATMSDFWSTVLLTSGRYKGNPMSIHLALPRLGREHFERWLGYWRATVSDLFGDVRGNLFVRKAEFMAERLLLAIDAHHSQTPESPDCAIL